MRSLPLNVMIPKEPVASLSVCIKIAFFGATVSPSIHGELLMSQTTASLWETHAWDSAVCGFDNGLSSLHLIPILSEGFVFLSLTFHSEFLKILFLKLSVLTSAFIDTHGRVLERIERGVEVGGQSGLRRLTFELSPPPPPLTLCRTGGPGSPFWCSMWIRAAPLEPPERLQRLSCRGAF